MEKVEIKKLLFIVPILAITIILASMYSQYFVSWTGFKTKTIWDWLDLLIVPLILAIAVYVLNESQQKRQRETEKNKKFQDTLDAYLDRMTDLLLKERLRDSSIESEVRTLARTLTLTALRNLDGKRKGQIIQFLYESKLIYRSKDKTIIYLDKADLTEADLSGLHLENALLNTCNLREANFKGAWLKGANLNQSNLYKANLVEVPLDYASLDMANLSHANLEGAMLWGTSCVGTHFENANLKKTMLGNPSVFFTASENEILTEEKKLSFDAVFSHDSGNFSANFANADLTGAKVGNYQLKAVCLKNTIMPNGKIYDTWLKEQDKDFRDNRLESDLKWTKAYEDFEKEKKNKLKN